MHCNIWQNVNIYQFLFVLSLSFITWQFPPNVIKSRRIYLHKELSFYSQFTCGLFLILVTLLPSSLNSPVRSIFSHFCPTLDFRISGGTAVSTARTWWSGDSRSSRYLETPQTHLLGTLNCLSCFLPHLLFLTS